MSQVSCNSSIRGGDGGGCDGGGGGGSGISGIGISGIGISGGGNSSDSSCGGGSSSSSGGGGGSSSSNENSLTKVRALCPISGEWGEADLPVTWPNPDSSESLTKGRNPDYRGVRTYVYGLYCIVCP